MLFDLLKGVQSEIKDMRQDFDEGREEIRAVKRLAEDQGRKAAEFRDWATPQIEQNANVVRQLVSIKRLVMTAAGGAFAFLVDWTKFESAWRIIREKLRAMVG